MNFFFFFNGIDNTLKQGFPISINNSQTYQLGLM